MGDDDERKVRGAYEKWDEADLGRAIAAGGSGESCLNNPAKHHGIPKVTLSRHLKGGKERSPGFK